MLYWSIYGSVMGIECHTGLYMGVLWNFNVRRYVVCVHMYLGLRNSGP